MKEELTQLQKDFNALLIQKYGTRCKADLHEINEKISAVVALVLYVPEHKINKELDNWLKT